MSDLVYQLNDLLNHIEQSPKRTRGGAGGQTIESTLAAQLVQISMLDTETIYAARDTIEALQAENARFKKLQLRWHSFMRAENITPFSWAAFNARSDEDDARAAHKETDNG